MRHLCPDADLRRAKGIPLHPIGSHAHAAEIVLGKRDRRAGKSEVPRLKAGLRKGDVAPHSLRFPLEEIQRNQVKDGLRHVRILRFEVCLHLLRRCCGIPHDLRVSVRTEGRTAHFRFDRPAERIHRVPRSKLRPQMLRVAVVAGNALAVAFPVADDHAIR